MPKRGPNGEWLDSKGRPVTMMDCVLAVHSGITRLTWEVTFGEKKDDKEITARKERDIEILGIIEEDFREAIEADRLRKEHERRQAKTIPGQRRR